MSLWYWVSDARVEGTAHCSHPVVITDHLSIFLCILASFHVFLCGFVNVACYKEPLAALMPCLLNVISFLQTNRLEGVMIVTAVFHVPGDLSCVCLLFITSHEESSVILIRG